MQVEVASSKRSEQFEHLYGNAMGDRSFEVQRPCGQPGSEPRLSAALFQNNADDLGKYLSYASWKQAGSCITYMSI